MLGVYGDARYNIIVSQYAGQNLVEWFDLESRTNTDVKEIGR